MKTKNWMLKIALLALPLLGMSNLVQASSPDSIPLIFPSGLHEVEHTSYTVKDGEKEMVVEFWYPADFVQSAKERPSFMDKTHFSNLLKKQVPVAAQPRKQQDIKDALMNNGKQSYPTLIFFADFGMDRIFTDALYRKLASNGFVIIEIDLPDLGAIVSV